MNEPWGHHVKQNKPVTEGQIAWFYLHEALKIVKVTESESRMVVVRGWRNGVPIQLYDVSVIQDE